MVMQSSLSPQFEGIPAKRGMKHVAFQPLAPLDTVNGFIFALIKVASCASPSIAFDEAELTARWSEVVNSYNLRALHPHSSVLPDIQRRQYEL